MPPDRALVIVDVQRAFSPPPELLKKLRRFSRRFSCRVFTRFIDPPGSLFRTVLKQSSCAPNSPDTELLIEPDPEDLVITKSTYGLMPRDLRKFHRRGIKRVTVCGVDTDACVLGVMFSLFDAGIVCHLKEDLCWSSSDLHEPAVGIARAQFPPPR